MLVLKTTKQEKIHRGKGTSNPTPKNLLLRLVHNCSQEQPAYCMRLSNTTTHVHRPLYVTMYHSNSHTGVKFFKKRKIIKVFKTPLQVQTKTKNHTLNQSEHWARIYRTNPQQAGLPSGVASSVVQD